MPTSDKHVLRTYKRALAQMRSSRKKAWQRASFHRDIDDSLPGAAPIEEDVTLSDNRQGRIPDQWLHDCNHNSQMASSMPTLTSIPSFSQSLRTWCDEEQLDTYASFYLLDGQEPQAASTTPSITPAAPSRPGSCMNAPVSSPATLPTTNGLLSDSQTAHLTMRCCSVWTDASLNDSTTTTPPTADIRTIPVRCTATGASTGMWASTSDHYAGLRAGFLLGPTPSPCDPPQRAVPVGIPASVPTATPAVVPNSVPTGIPASTVDGGLSHGNPAVVPAGIPASAPAGVPAGRPLGLRAGFLVGHSTSREARTAAASPAGIPATGVQQACVAEANFVGASPADVVPITNETREVVAARHLQCTPAELPASEDAAHKGAASAALHEALLDLDIGHDVLAAECLIDSAGLGELLPAGSFTLTEVVVGQPMAAHEEELFGHMSDCQALPHKVVAGASKVDVPGGFLSLPYDDLCGDQEMPLDDMAPAPWHAKQEEYFGLSQEDGGIEDMALQPLEPASDGYFPFPHQGDDLADMPLEPLEEVHAGPCHADGTFQRELAHCSWVCEDDGLGEPLQGMDWQPEDDMGLEPLEGECQEQGACDECPTSEDMTKSLAWNLRDVLDKMQAPLRASGLLQPNCPLFSVPQLESMTGKDPFTARRERAQLLEECTDCLLAHAATVTSPPAGTGRLMHDGGGGPVFDCGDYVTKFIFLTLDDLEKGGVHTSIVEVALALMYAAGWLTHREDSRISDATGCEVMPCSNIVEARNLMIPKHMQKVETSKQNMGIILCLKYPKMDGDLSKHIQDHLHNHMGGVHTINIVQAVDLATQITLAVEQWHVRLRGVHNDLKAENMLVQNMTRNPKAAGVGGVRLKLTDTGAATVASNAGPLEADGAMLRTPHALGQARALKFSQQDYRTNKADDVAAEARIILQVLLGRTRKQIARLCNSPRALLLAAQLTKEELKAICSASEELRRAWQSEQAGPCWEALQEIMLCASHAGPAGKLFLKQLSGAARMALVDYVPQIQDEGPLMIPQLLRDQQQLQHEAAGLSEEHKFLTLGSTSCPWPGFDTPVSVSQCQAAAAHQGVGLGLSAEEQIAVATQDDATAGSQGHDDLWGKSASALECDDIQHHLGDASMQLLHGHAQILSTGSHSAASQDSDMQLQQQAGQCASLAAHPDAVSSLHANMHDRWCAAGSAMTVCCNGSAQESVAAEQCKPDANSACIYVMAGLDLNSSSSSSNAPMQPECVAAGLVSQSVQAVVLSTATSLGVQDMVPCTSGAISTASSGQKAARSNNQAGNAHFWPINTRRRRLRDSNQQAPPTSPPVKETEQHSVPPQCKWQRACMWGALGAVAATAVVVVAGVCRARR